MQRFDTIQQLRALDDVIFRALDDYCADTEAYPSDAALGINRRTREVMLDSPAYLNGLEIHPIAPLLFDGMPDADATALLAGRYVAVR